MNLLQLSRQPSPLRFSRQQAPLKSGRISIDESLTTHRNSSLHTSKQFNHASSQTDLFEEIEPQLPNIFQALMRRPSKKRLPLLLKPYEKSQQDKSPFQPKARQIKRAIQQNKNRVISVVSVNHPTQFIQFLFNNNYFDMTPDVFYATNLHYSFQVSSLTITNSIQMGSINNYNDILVLTKKQKIYDVQINKLAHDTNQNFIVSCPDIIIASCSNLTEEVTKRKKQKQFAVCSADQIIKEAQYNLNHKIKLRIRVVQ